MRKNVVGSVLQQVLEFFFKYSLIKRGPYIWFQTDIVLKSDLSEILHGNVKTNFKMFLFLLFLNFRRF